MMKTDPAIQRLIEEATVDCYDEGECRVGFATMLEENLKTPCKAKLRGQMVTVTSINGDERVIKVFIKKGSFVFPIDILDLDIDQAMTGSEWLAAYRKWEKGK